MSYLQLHPIHLYSGAVRVGYIDKESVINPTRKELADSQLNLIVTGTKNKKIGNYAFVFWQILITI